MRKHFVLGLLLLAIASIISIPAAAQSSSITKAAFNDVHPMFMFASHSFTLTWTQSTSTDVTGNKVYCAPTTGGPYTTPRATLTTPSTSYGPDTNVVGNQVLFCVVTAVNAAGESPFSNEVKLTIPPDPKPAPASGLTGTVQ